MTIKISSKHPSALVANRRDNKLRTNGTLRPREWNQYDTAVVDVTRERAGALGYLIGRGLVVNGSFGKTVSFYNIQSEMDTITSSIHPTSNIEKDQMEWDEVGVKVPFFQGNFSVDDRTLQASRTNGEDIETSGVKALTANMWIEVNRVLANGWGGAGDNRVYGLTNRDGGSSVTITANVWNGANNADTDGKTIDGNVNNALKSMYEKNFFGPFVLFVSKNIWASLQRMYNPEYPNITIKDRIEQYVDIESVMPLDQLADNTAVLVQVTSDVLDVYVGMPLMPFEFPTSRFTMDFGIGMAIAPRIKKNYNGDAGVVLLQA